MRIENQIDKQIERNEAKMLQKQRESIIQQIFGKNKEDNGFVTRRKAKAM